ncbi:sensor histidine kinase [Aurantimonas aggregata]|nr:HWE histidine kinase domain-containing protein [Aurantimonas aggregata]
MLGSRQPMLVVWGPERLTLYNDGYALMCGDRHPGALGRPFSELWFDIWDVVEPILDRAYAGEPTHMDDIQFTMRRHGDPEETHFAFSYTPVRDEAGQVAGMFCACTETTGEILAERRLAAETDRQRRLFQKAPGFITILRGPNFVFEFANEAYVRLFGGRDVVGKTVREVFPDLEGQPFFGLLENAYSTGERFVAQQTPIRLRSSPNAEPKELFLDFIYEPVTDEAGVVTGLFVEGYDVTERKKGEEHLRLMINELNHRVKNSLATVQAIASQTFRNPEAFEASKRDFNERLVSLARAHDILTDANWAGATLRQVVDHTVRPHGGEAGERFRLDGPQVVLTPKVALTLSMTLHELCTNAAKYGALSVEYGQVSIAWSCPLTEDGRRLHLTWTERGGPAVLPPKQKGFGSRLIERGLAAELGGIVDIAYEQAGVVCTVDVPLPAEPPDA